MSARDLLFELGTEELPPRTLQSLSAALTDGLAKGLRRRRHRARAGAGFATPRRLAVLHRRLRRTRAGPARRAARAAASASAFDAAAARPPRPRRAFAKSCGVDGGRSRAADHRQGRVAGVSRHASAAPRRSRVLGGHRRLRRSRRCRSRSACAGARAAAEFVRPVHSVVLLFGEEVVPVEVLGPAGGPDHPRPPLPRAAAACALQAPRSLRGAACAAPRWSRISRARRETDPRRRDRRAAAAGRRPRADRGALLDEVTALVEWPVPIAGRFEAALPRAAARGGDRHRSGSPALLPDRRRRTARSPAASSR